MIGIGSTVGNYVVRSVLGEGGMGKVWLAEHPLIGRKMAVKTIHPDFARNPEALSRFFTEALAATRIGHAAIVDIVDYGQTSEGEAYFVMEVLAGDSILQTLAARRPSITEIVEIGYQLADGVAAAHAAGILHRDLKPENVYLIPRTSGVQVKVLDFGLAKLTADDGPQAQHKTRIGAVMGTPYYMAPEQCAGHGRLDGRVDVYAAGVLLYEMITGVRPFTGEAFTEILIKHMTEPPVPILARAPECPPWLAALVEKMLAKEPDARPWMADVAAQLGAAAAANSPRPTSAPGVPRPASSPGQRPVSYQGAAPVNTTLGLSSGEHSVVSPMPARKSRLPLIAGALVVVALGAGIAGLTLRGKTDAAPIPTAAPEPSPSPNPEPNPNPNPSPNANPSPVPKPEPAPAPAVVPPVPALPERVTLVLESDPPGASVLLDGVHLGVTPYSHETIRSETPLRFTFQREGFEPRTKDVSPDQGRVVAVALQALPAKDKDRDRRRRPPRDPDKTPPPPGDTRPPIDDDLLAPK